MTISSRKKDTIFMVSANLFLQFVTLICGFILPPLIIQIYGSPVNGMIASINQFITYLNLVEAGVGGAAIAALYKPLAEKNKDLLNGILASTKNFYNRSGFIFSVLILLLAFLYPLIIKEQIEYLSTFLMVLVLGISGTAEFFLIGKYKVLLTADKKIYVVSIVQAIALFFSTAISVFMINNGFGILAVKFAASLIFLLRYFFLFGYFKKNYPSISFSAIPNDKALSQNRNVLVHQISGLVVNAFPAVLLTIYCTLTDVSIYAVYALVFTGISNLLGALTNGIQSIFGESLVKDSKETTQKLFSRYENVYFLTLSWCYGCTSLLILPFMGVYTKNMIDANYIQPALSVMFVFAGVMNSLRSPASRLIIAAGHYKETQKRALIEMSINITTSFIFVICFGLRGVLLGSICSSIYRNIDMFVYTNKRILERGWEKPLLKIVLIIAVFVLTVFMIYPHIPHNCVSNYYEWFMLALIVGTVLFVVVLIIFFVLGIFEKIKVNNMIKERN